MDLQPRYHAIIQEILRTIVPEVEVRAFGSRITGGAKEHSDLPFRVEVHEWWTLDPEFRAVIGPESEIWQNGTA